MIALDPPGTRLGERTVLDELDRRFYRRHPRHELTGNVLLLGCATTDITSPYHSLSYLKAALTAQGQAAGVRDLGIEFWHYLTSPAVVGALREECARRSAGAAADRRALFGLFAGLLEDETRFTRAWRRLSERASFFDIRQYVEAVHELGLLPRLLTLLSRDAKYRSFSSMSPPGSETDRINLDALRASVEGGFGIEAIDYFYDHHADEIAAARPSLVGFTIPFISQLTHSLALAHRLRKRGIPTTIGGPIAAKFYKYAQDPADLRALSFAVDYLATGEGETLVPAMADAMRAGRIAAKLPNLVDLHDPKPLDSYHFEIVNALPAPDYSMWDYDLYASPEPGGLYSPTRGCYWNRCNFCDYGLSTDGPTSPWRVRDPQKVADDLTAAAPYVKHFFFAVDVLSPAYAKKMAKVFIERGLSVKWMADFRLESMYDPETVELFHRAGCLGAAFGMESADEDVLELIDKGTNPARLDEIVANFAGAGIPVQLMGFLGFPGEHAEEAAVTVSRSLELSKTAATVALGRFGLTPGSNVARKPDAFGIDVLYERKDYPAIPWELQWRYRDGSPPAADDHSAGLGLMRGFPFPFLGSTTTLHSLLYFERRAHAPFPIPAWSSEAMRGEPFHVIPAYFSRPEPGEQTLLLSGLTGRAIYVPRAVAALLEQFFGDGEWPVVRAGDGDAGRFIGFLTEHALAMFLPVAART